VFTPKCSHSSFPILPPVYCQETAVILTAFPNYDDDDSVDTSSGDWIGWCEEHALEEVHEVKTSHSDEEYLVIQVPKS
jgi:hypothetical protein